MASYQHPDLHMHSLFSDGSDTPETLLSAVRTCGLDIFSLTDHDSVTGCVEVMALLKPTDAHFVFGVELSCEENDRGSHILGYGLNIEKPSIREALEFTQNERKKKAGHRLEFLEEAFGFTFTDEDKARILNVNNPGKPHFARVMMEKGYVATMKEAFPLLDQYQGMEKKLTPAEGIDAILRADGIPVLAHGILGEGNEVMSYEDIAERVAQFKKDGLMGVEAYYSAYTPEQKEIMLSLAEDNNLLITAGSDYHGINKKVPLGDTNAPLPEKMERFYKMLAFMGK